ncbi:unnamed protein product [Moneuplotes crassus]|uniref:Acyl-coenzyme A oxidase n=1 Tax=Euplotes crassus TaxID=5936 RepID=A0AAD1U670_EUPCR|nr:unnamed protein product [Moneuplotes crassus]
MYSEEVKKANFELDELRYLVHGGKQEYDEMNKIYGLIKNNPNIRHKSTERDLDRHDKMAEIYRRVPEIRKMVEENNIKRPDFLNYSAYGVSYNSAYAFNVHHGMFTAIINILGSKEQVEKYYEKACSEEIIGCYAQTEVGHGSDVQGLMTTATFDRENQEFILHSPNVKSYKFWPGELGLSCTHAVVFARLIIDGDDYGVNVFFAPIRDEVTHKPLEGIEVGEIGPKAGYTTKDNGYLAFNQFRIPRKAILSRYVNVTKDGMITLEGDPKIAYATMLLIRVTLLRFSWQALFYGIYYTLNYVTFRSQFKSIPGSAEERKLIDYQATQKKLIPIISFTFGNLFGYIRCFKMYNQMQEEIKDGNFKLMKKLHTLCCSFKAYYMDECYESLKILRELCGAHGYWNKSGFDFLLDVKSAHVTLEGDAVVMFQQTARDLFKKKKKQEESIKLLSNPDIHEIDTLLELLKACAYCQMYKTRKDMDKDTETPESIKWNKVYLVDIIKSAKYHAIYKTAKITSEEIIDANLSENLTNNLQALCKIFICDNILKHGQEAFIQGYLTTETMFSIKDEMDILFGYIRPQLSALIEGTHFEDKDSFSVLLQDGKNAYENFYEEVAKNPLNKSEKLEAYDTYLKPLSQKLISRL